jgi:hypothetical protein
MKDSVNNGHEKEPVAGCNMSVGHVLKEQETIQKMRNLRLRPDAKMRGPKGRYNKVKM